MAAEREIYGEKATTDEAMKITEFDWLTQLLITVAGWLTQLNFVWKHYQPILAKLGESTGGHFTSNNTVSVYRGSSCDCKIWRVRNSA